MAFRPSTGDVKRFVSAGKGDADARVLIFVVEDGKENAVHCGAVGEDADWPGAQSDRAEASLDGLGGAHGFAWAKRSSAKR